MTDNEKKEIINLRSNGESYGKIAKALGLSANTVKSFCQRQSADKQNGDVCKCCGKPIKHTEHKRKKQFCSDDCRMRWWREHRQLINRATEVSKKCACCGKEFKSYPKDNRKYCSHECYINGRFGK